MTEQKKMSELLQEQIDSLQKEVAELKKSQKTTSTERKHSEKVVFDCPDCKKEYDSAVVKAAKPQIEKEWIEKLKNGKLQQCDGCGEIVDEQTTECPTCKGRHGHVVR